MLKVQIPLFLSFAQHAIYKNLSKSLHVLKVWKIKLALILSLQIGQNVFKTQMLLKLIIRFT